MVVRRKGNLVVAPCGAPRAIRKPAHALSHPSEQARRGPRRAHERGTRQTVQVVGTASAKPTLSVTYTLNGQSTGNGLSGFVTSQAQPGVANEFNDNLADCPTSIGTACSFTWANQQWQQINSDNSYSSIGTVGPVSVTSFSEPSVDGNSSSLTGTTFLQ